MRATTIRVEADVKAELDRLQGHVQAETGERVSHSELLRRLVAVARRHEMEFFTPGGEPWRPPTPEQLRRLRGLVKDWDVAADVGRIDDDLYGGGIED